MIRQSLSKLKGKSSLLWSIKIGRMHSRNNVIAKDGRVYVGTSGAQWNEPDSEDGVYCLDMASGSKLWFRPTSTDANEISIINGLILVGTDGGTLYAITPHDGSVAAKYEANAAVCSRAISLESEGREVAISLSVLGEVFQFDFEKKTFQSIGILPFKTRANPVAISASEFLVGTEDGAIVRVTLEGAHGISWEQLCRIEPYTASGPYKFQLQITAISSIQVAGDRIIVSYARQTHDRRPPIACFSLATGKKLWDAGRIHSASKTENSEFGNSRITPVIWNGYILSTFSYNESAHAFSLDTGKWVWRVRLDDSYFQNWSSPVVERDLLYVARVNGVLSVIDINKREIIDSHSVEVFDLREKDTHSTEGIAMAEAPWPNSNSSFYEGGPYPSQILLAGICSTPVIAGSRVIVGTVSGHLRCLSGQSSQERDMNR